MSYANLTELKTNELFSINGGGILKVLAITAGGLVVIGGLCFMASGFGTGGNPFLVFGGTCIVACGVLIIANA